MIIKDFFKLAQDKELNHKGDESPLLDSVTLTYLTMMNTLSDIEKHTKDEKKQVFENLLNELKKETDYDVNKLITELKK